MEIRFCIDSIRWNDILAVGQPVIHFSDAHPAKTSENSLPLQFGLIWTQRVIIWQHNLTYSKAPSVQPPIQQFNTIIKL